MDQYLKAQVDKIADDVVEIKVDMAEVKVSTAVNTASLQEHMMQTQEVKKQTALLFEGIEKLKQDVDSRMKPVETVIDRIKFTGVILGALGGVVVGAYQLGLFDALKRTLGLH